jgi:hypothetical protein
MTLYSLNIRGNKAGYGVWRKRNCDCGRRNLVVLTGEWRGRIAGIEGRVLEQSVTPAAAGNSTPPFAPLILRVTCHAMKDI